MNVYLLTHPASTTFKDSFASLKEFGYNPIIINGYTRYDYLKSNEICYSSFRDNAVSQVKLVHLYYPKKYSRILLIFFIFCICY